MEERREVEYEEDEVDPGKYLSILRHHLWQIIGLSLAVGIVTLLLLFLKPNLYKAIAVITPAGDEGKQNPTLGALASFGVVVGGPTKVEDIEALFKSNDLTVRVFRKYNLWPIVAPDRFDAKPGI